MHESNTIRAGKISREDMLREAQNKAEENDAQYVTKNQIYELIQGQDWWMVPNTNTVVCCLILKSGFTIVESAACIDDKLFEESIGRQYSYSKAVDRLYTLYAFHVMERDHYADAG